MSINVRSEIAPLKKVLLHRPGKELENMAPEFLERLLFDDIPYLKRAQEEHDAFAELLRNNGIEVVYLHELAAVAIEDPEIRKQFIYQFIVEAGIKHPRLKETVYHYLDEIKDNEALIRRTMEGIQHQDLPETNEAKGLAELAPNAYPFVADPMPNLYFTRDPFASIGNTASVNKMYSVMRDREVIYADYIFNYHPEYVGTQKSYKRYFDFSIEGGDILTLNEKLLAVGISQRTQAEAIEKLAQQLFFEMADNTVETILAFDIPKIRAYMHLDTVFTQIDHDKFTVHPGIEDTLVVFELTKGTDGEILIKEEKGSLEEILERHLGHKVTLIPCGGGDYVISQREQWNDGSNTLCIRPGEVVVYGRNDVTNALLEEHGIKLHVIPCSELSRGRGGPRCMSMPLIRE
ncbi:MAG: arginine deiminase [Turicibacter sp.]|nr:arginine deiminase [Turicibacter sp.]